MHRISRIDVSSVFASTSVTIVVCKIRKSEDLFSRIATEIYDMRRFKVKIRRTNNEKGEYYLFQDTTIPKELHLNDEETDLLD